MSMSNGSNMKLPAALMTKPIPAISTMNIETNILDPLIVNNSFARFVLERKGILDAGSTFTFAVTCDAAADADDKAFLPARTGINSLIKQAVLKVGTKVLATSTDFNFYETMRRQFKTSEEKALKDMIKVGTMDNLEPQNSGNGLYQIADTQYPTALPAATDGLVNSFIAIKSDPTQTPVFQVKLSDLFPMARNLQLPLFVINEQVSVEFTFNTQAATGNGKVVSFDKSYLPGGNQAISVSSLNCQFLADYLTYDDATMDETAQMVMSDSGMILPYEDLLLTTATLPASGSTTKSVSDIAVANRRVRAIMLHQGVDATNEILGVYGSPANNIPESYNLRINDVLYYPRPVQREATKYTQLSQVFGVDLNVANAEYSLDALTNKQDATQPINNHIISANTFAGHSQQVLEGQQHFVGVNLSTSPLNILGTGTLVGQKPIQFEIDYFNTGINGPARTLRFYSLVERQFTLKGGNVFVSA